MHTDGQVKNGATGSQKNGRMPDVLASVQIRTANSDVLPEDLALEPAPQKIEYQFDKWVRFFDQDSAFLKSMMLMVDTSPTLRRVIQDKSNMTVGDGFIPNQGDSNVLLTILRKLKSMIGIQDAALEELNEYIKKVNLHGQSLADVMYELAFNYYGFGNVVVELVKTVDADGEPVLYIYNKPLYMLGQSKAGHDLIVESFGFHPDWDSISINDPDIAEVAVYPNWTKDQEGDERTIIHVKNYSPGLIYWGLPDWISARLWAKIEYRIPKYNISKFENGFVPSSIVQFYGSVTKTEAEKIIADFQKCFTDTGNHHKVFAQVLRDERLKANVQILEDKNQGNFLELQRLASQAIVTAARYTMSLAGFATSGKLGTNQQIRQEAEFVHNMSIKPVQNVLLHRIINVFLKEAAEYTEASWKEVSLSVSNSMPVSFMGEIAVEDNLMINEKREILGYDALDDDQIQQLMAQRRELSPLAISQLAEVGKEIGATTDEELKEENQ